MSQANKVKIFLVDDDSLFLKLLSIEFIENGNFDIQTFASGELCLAHLSEKPDLIILDYHLNGIDKNAMNGIDTLIKIKAYLSTIPVVMLSSQDKIDVAVSSMYHGAFDYVVKSETSFLRLQKAIDTIFSYKKIEKELQWYMNRM
jgi:two-component system OmpR family response regulator